MRTGATVLLLLAAGPAFAQEKLCAGEFSHDEWAKAMDKADQQMSQFKLKDARVTVYSTRELVPCLDQLVKPSYLGRYARQVALLEFLSQDEETATRWGELQRVVAPDLPWPADIAEDHPFRELVTGLELPTQSGPKDKSLLIPKGGGAFLDGTPILYPQAWSEIPNLVQIADGDGKITSAYWQDGGAFHDEALTELGKTPKPPKWFVPEPASAVASMALPLVFGTKAVADSGEDEVPDPVPVAAAPKPASSPVPATTAVVAPTPSVGNGWSEATAPVAAAPKPAPPPLPPVAPVAPAPVAAPAPAPAPVAAAPKPGPAPVAAVVPPPAPTPAPVAPTAAAAPKPAPAPTSAVVPKPAPAAPAPAPEPVAVHEPEPPASHDHKGPNGVLLGAGAVSAIAAGTLYAVAAVSSGGLADATTEDELVAARSRTNGMVFGAGAAGIVAVGLSTTAFLTADGWTLGVHGRF